MVTAIYPGSFDPVTRGHLDISEKFVFAVPNYRHKMLRFLVNLPSTPIFSQQGIDSAIC